MLMRRGIGEAVILGSLKIHYTEEENIHMI